MRPAGGGRDKCRVLRGAQSPLPTRVLERKNTFPLKLAFNLSLLCRLFYFILSTRAFPLPARNACKPWNLRAGAPLALKQFWRNKKNFYKKINPHAKLPESVFVRLCVTLNQMASSS